MSQNDPQRYTVQATKILSDLLGDNDTLDAVRFPSGLTGNLGHLFPAQMCALPADRTLALTLDPGRQADFKDELDTHVQYGGGTHFAAPLRTAIRFLNRDAGAARMLLIVADEGGLGPCEAQLTRELVQLRGSGALVAQIHLGSGGSAFGRNPAFDFTQSAPSARDLLAALAHVYQRFIGGDHVQTGDIAEEFSVKVLPGAREAFVVVSLDGELADLEVEPGHPRADEVDANYRGGGFTVGLDRVQRNYRIVRLRRPAAGRWRFRLYGAEGEGGWLLIQDYGTRWTRSGSPSPAGGNEPAPVTGADATRRGAASTPPGEGVGAPPPPDGPEAKPTGVLVYTPSPVPSPPPLVGAAAPRTPSAEGAAVRIPRLGPRTQAIATLDLTSRGLQGPLTLGLSTNVPRASATVEVLTSQGWQRLGSDPIPVALPVGSKWPLRLWTGRCPSACSPGLHAIDVVTLGSAPGPARVRVPVFLEVAGVSRVRCHGPAVLGVALLTAGLAAAWVLLVRRHPASRRASQSGRKRGA